MDKSLLPPPPVFGVNGSTEKINRNGIIALVDIFDDFLFSNDSSANEQGAYDKLLSKKEKTENFSDYDDDDGDQSSSDEDEESNSRKRQKNTHNRLVSDDQKTERRERNREHAKRSRVRKKFLLESLQHSVKSLEEENDRLRSAIKRHLGKEGDELLQKCLEDGPSVIAMNPHEATRTLDDPDYSLVKALQNAQQNFVISDPSLPDNPIVYASYGFLLLTGYKQEEVLGRNCRFLQGPDTDPKAVEKIRTGIEKGEDTTVVLLNYRKDKSTFWNQFFVAALRDGEGNVVNYLGVQCKVSDDYAVAFEIGLPAIDTKK